MGAHGDGRSWGSSDGIAEIAGNEIISESTVTPEAIMYHSQIYNRRPVDESVFIIK